MRLITFDTETTGTDPQTDRIVTAYVGIYDSEQDSHVSEASWLIAPEIPIPDEAAKIHGISDAHARTHGLSPAEAIPGIVGELERLTSDGTPLVVFNAPFDLTLIAAEARRLGVATDWLSEVNVIDPLVIDRACWPRRRGHRRLTDMSATYSLPVLEQAHTADADCLMAARLAMKLIETYRLIGPGTPRELHAQEVLWHRAWAQRFQAYLRAGGTPDAQIDPAWPVRELA
ncbi:exonuclease domain-containing protein [Pseudoclavibacter soli]|uniref:exonuclease domain-containing protein n=1 Tax=Pseudoclavibacter soli TaxID=452623 RepID=UPI000407852D|nr:exonuclease domain-containing protein [Pseudoclavibacter soli]